MDILIDNLRMDFFYIQTRKMCLSKEILYQYFVANLPCLGRLQF